MILILKKMSECDKNCCICFFDYSRDYGILKDGNDNHDIESQCHHWFCIYCLKDLLYRQMYNCPLCRENISELLATYESDESDESDDENQ